MQTKNSGSFHSNLIAKIFTRKHGLTIGEFVQILPQGHVPILIYIIAAKTSIRRGV